MAERGQLSLGFGHREAMGEDDFLAAPCNEQALAWVRRWPDWPAIGIALHGPEGCGKSHLGAIWCRRAGAQRIDAASLTRDRVPEMLSAGSIWLIDPAENLADETALFHLINALGEARGGLLLAARQPPARWPVALPDLRSRLAALPAVGIGQPDDSLMAAVLVKLFADRQLRVEQEVIAYLLPRIERSFEAARQLVAAADAASLAHARAVTIPLLRGLLEDGSRGGPA